MTTLAARILAVLPQTQCTRCGFTDCDAYAQAIARDGASINQCPPGGTQGIERLAAITGKPITALNPANGEEGPRTVAFIDETWCIGCTLCLQACPTDAIMGGQKLMHTIIEAYCTGCELCLPVCPVDCIALENVTGTSTGWSAWSPAQATLARTRYQLSIDRRSCDKGESGKEPEEKIPGKLATLPLRSEHLDTESLNKKRAAIDAAVKRATAKRTPGTRAP